MLHISRGTAPEPAWLIQMRVIRALILRDIRTRFFGHGAGYLIAIAWPLAHIGILLAIYAGLGRATPYGNSMVLYFATSLAPTMAFIYASRWIMLSVIGNRTLLGFPVVKLVDILIARGILEGLASCCMVLVLLAIMAAAGIDIRPVSSPEAMKAMAAAILLGLGLGFINGVIAMVYPLWATAYSLVIIVLYLSSGVLFIPDGLPEPVRYIVSFNPVLHSIEWIRSAYYGAYVSRTLDKSYLLSFGIGSVFISLVAMRLGQKLLTR